MFYKIFSSASFSTWVTSWNNNLIIKWCREGGPVVMCRPLYSQVSNGPLKTLPSCGYSFKRIPVYSAANHQERPSFVKMAKSIRIFKWISSLLIRNLNTANAKGEIELNEIHFLQDKASYLKECKSVSRIEPEYTSKYEDPCRFLLSCLFSAYCHYWCLVLSSSWPINSCNLQVL